MSVYLNSINDDYEVKCDRCGSTERYNHHVSAERAYESHLSLCHTPCGVCEGKGYYIELWPRRRVGCSHCLRTGYLPVHYRPTDEVPGDQLGAKALLVVGMALSAGAAIGTFAHLIVGWLS